MNQTVLLCSGQAWSRVGKTASTEWTFIVAPPRLQIIALSRVCTGTWRGYWSGKGIGDTGFVRVMVICMPRGPFHPVSCNRVADFSTALTSCVHESRNAFLFPEANAFGRRRPAAC